MRVVRERGAYGKVINYPQSRLGTNKRAIAGLLQPVVGAVKLFTKNITLPGAGTQLFFDRPGPRPGVTGLNIGAKGYERNFYYLSSILY